MSFVDSLKKGLFGSEDDYDDQYMDDGPQMVNNNNGIGTTCLLYTSPSPRDCS